MLGTYSGTSRGKAQHNGIIYIDMKCWELEIQFMPGRGKIPRNLCAPRGDHRLENL